MKRPSYTVGWREHGSWWRTMTATTSLERATATTAKLGAQGARAAAVYEDGEMILFEDFAAHARIAEQSHRGERAA